MSTTTLASAQYAATEVKCEALASGYEHGTATVEQRQDYANCINILHPSPLTAGEVLFVKAVILCALAGATIVTWKFWDDKDFFEIVVFSIAGAIVGGFVPPLCFVIIETIKFLFTA